MRETALLIYLALTGDLLHNQLLNVGQPNSVFFRICSQYILLIIFALWFSGRYDSQPGLFSPRCFPVQEVRKYMAQSSKRCGWVDDWGYSEETEFHVHMLLGLTMLLSIQQSEHFTLRHKCEEKLIHPLETMNIYARFQCQSICRLSRSSVRKTVFSFACLSLHFISHTVLHSVLSHTLTHNFIAVNIRGC